MHPQNTDSNVIENEKEQIKNVAGLSSIDEITLIDEGWDSRVYTFNGGRYYFKFPRIEEIRKRYRYEIAAIKLATSLTTEVKTLRIIWEHPENNYFGYEGINGKTLKRAVTELDDRQKSKLGQSLGSFLRQLHRQKPDESRTMSLEDEYKNIQGWYKDIAGSLRLYFSAGEQKKLDKLVYESWPEDLINLGYSPVFSHGDLNFDNVVFGENDSVGIIDFGDSAFWDQSKDFLKIKNDEIVFKAALKAYGQRNENIMEKIALRQAMNQIISLGFHIGKQNYKIARFVAERIKSSFQ